VFAVWSAKEAESAAVKYAELIAVALDDVTDALKGWVISHAFWDIFITLCAFLVAAVWGKVKNIVGPLWLLLALLAAGLALAIVKVFGIAGGILVGILLVVSIWMVLREKGHLQHQKTRKRGQILSLVYWSFEHHEATPQRESLTFKRKIRAVLRNDAGEEIEVDTPGWAMDAGDLSIQPTADSPGAASRIRLENKQAGGWKLDKWLEETKHLIVPSGYHFETWVGLSNEYTNATLEQHRRDGRIGTLVFPVLVEGQGGQVEIRVS
jgi:hypothetical protein